MKLTDANRPKVLTVSFTVANHAVFQTEEDVRSFEESLVNMLQTAVFETSKNVAENTHFEQFRKKVDAYKINNFSEADARHLAIAEETRRILMSFLR